MLNYLRAEFYKVFRRKYTWITLAVVLGLEALLVFGWASIHINGVKVDFSSGVQALTLMLPIGFYVTLLTGDMVFANQYKNNTLRNEVSFGLSRARIYLGKFIAQTVLSILFCVVMVGFYLALCWLTQGHDPVLTAQTLRLIGYCLTVAFPLWVGMQAVACAMYFLVRSELGAAFAAIGVLDVLPNMIWMAAAMLNGSAGHPVGRALDQVYLHTPRAILDAALNGDWTLRGRAWLVGFVWAAAFTAIGLLGFQRKEIR